MWKAPSATAKNTKKQVRKPVSSNFAPKRLAINFQPPTIILQYLVIDTGKLYHHKMRLDSILRKANVNRNDVLNYVKTKHHLYFIDTKLKDQQILKFIDKILLKTGKISSLTKIQQKNDHLESSPSGEYERQGQQQDDDFDYLNDDDQYEEDYEDYEEEPKPAMNNNKQNNSYKPALQTSSFTTKTLQKPTVSPPQNKNTFMTYCQQEYDEDNEEEQGQANWDLDIDQNADFDFV